jgi:hypothetical protein
LNLQIKTEKLGIILYTKIKEKEVR